MGQLVVTIEVIASKINNMKDNKSPGVDGIPPKILKVKRRATLLIPGLRGLIYKEILKEYGLTTLETRRLRGIK